MSIILQIFLAWFYSHILENILHRALHNRKLFKKGFKNHFAGHHKKARKNNMYDDNYLNFFGQTSLFELKSLFVLYALHLPIALFYPIAYIVLVSCGVNYYYIHRRCHIDVEWGKNNYPHHYNHHMAKNQHDNWGVRANWPDKIINKLFYK